MKKEITYEEAMSQLETIVKQLERNELSIDELSAKVKEATGAAVDSLTGALRKAGLPAT